jgi:tRNA G46 methylase TrmB
MPDQPMDAPEFKLGRGTEGAAPTVVRRPRSVYADRLHEFAGVAFADEAAFGHRGHWRDFFRRRIGAGFDGRVIFEVGCFDADYLTRVAAKYPRTGFVGLDWKCKALHAGAQRVTELGLGNVALLRGRGQDVRRIFADGEVDEVWVFHPDPFAESDELKNRLIAEPFLVDVHAVLRGGGSALVLKTDHPGYYQWALGLFGVPEPDGFHAARDPGAVRIGPGTPAPRVRARDLMRAEDLPGRSEAVVSRFGVAARSADFWNDPAVLAHAADRCFAGEVTLFESRFIKKRLPIYYFEMAKKA